MSEEIRQRNDPISCRYDACVCVLQENSEKNRFRMCRFALHRFIYYFYYCYHYIMLAPGLIIIRRRKTCPSIMDRNTSRNNIILCGHVNQIIGTMRRGCVHYIA